MKLEKSVSSGCDRIYLRQKAGGEGFCPYRCENCYKASVANNLVTLGVPFVGQVMSRNYCRSSGLSDLREVQHALR